MRIKYSLFISLFFLLSTAFTNSSRGYSFEKPIFKSQKSKGCIAKSNNSSYSLNINPIESIPVINLQAHKTIHCFQATFCTANNFVVCLKCYNFFAGRGQNHNFTSQKIFLFPFHTFW
jgi:hypothetical protein